MIPTPDNTVVTGAGGWLGTGLVSAFTDNGPYKRPGCIRALVRDQDDADRLSGLSDNIEPVIGDLTLRPDLERLFDGLSGTTDVVHAAGVIHPTTFDELDAVNHLGTVALLDVAARAGIRRMVHVSSNSPFGTNASRADTFRNDEPYHPYYGYGQSKMLAELRVIGAAERGLNVVMARPPWFYGPHQPARQTQFFTMVRTGRFPVLGDGGQRRSMVYIGNLVQGVVRAELTPTDPGLGWWIADEHPYTVNEIVETVGAVMCEEGFDVKPNRLRLPNIVGSLAERVDGLLQSSGRYNQQFHVLGEMNKTIAVDISAAKRDLGYQPDIALAEGMRSSVQWCLDQGIEL
jgi:nucleoside-diphosphate-sugar epimerase